MLRVLSRSILVAAFLCLVLGTFLGCSSEKRYQVMSFFFDGVPTPDNGVRVNAEGQAASYVHKPYADGKCGSCHASDDVDMSISRPTFVGDITASVCLKCHGKIPTQYTVMHGPVASAECLLCHAPHDSVVPHLLVAPAPRVCVQCHTPEMMSPRRPEHQDEKASCLDCHMAHGGPRHGMLRPRGTATRPAAVATTQPAARVGDGI